MCWRLVCFAVKKVNVIITVAAAIYLGCMTLLKKNTETQIYGKFQIRHNQTSACSDCYGMRPLIWDEQFLSLFLCLCFSQDHLPLNASSTSLPPSATVFFSPFLDLSPQLPETTIIKLLKCCLAAINQWR